MLLRVRATHTKCWLLCVGHAGYSQNEGTPYPALFFSEISPNVFHHRGKLSWVIWQERQGFFCSTSTIVATLQLGLRSKAEKGRKNMKILPQTI